MRRMAAALPQLRGLRLVKWLMHTYAPRLPVLLPHNGAPSELVMLPPIFDIGLMVHQLSENARRVRLDASLGWTGRGNEELPQCSPSLGTVAARRALIRLAIKFVGRAWIVVLSVGKVGEAGFPRVPMRRVP